MSLYRNILRVHEKLSPYIYWGKTKQRARELTEADASCNVCGSKSFANKKNRILVRCKNCNSLERTRVLKLMLDQHDILRATSKVLHIAPERGLSDFIRGVIGDDNYTTADISPSNYAHIPNIKKIDLCESLESVRRNEGYDLVIHSHVLEHVPCNWSCALKNLNNLLKPNGHHIFCIPVMDGKYEESLKKLSAREATRRFGQYDHVRSFGIDSLSQTIGMVIPMTKHVILTSLFSKKKLESINIPPDQCEQPTGLFIWKKEEFLI